MLRALAGLLAFVAVAATAWAANSSDADLPPARGVLFWRGAQQLSGFRNIDRVFATRRIARGNSVYPLPKAEVEPTISFSHGGRVFGLEDFMQANNVAGLIVVQNGKVLLERYRLGNNAATRWITFSMTKSVVSLLAGVAIAQGKIASIDDQVTTYLPRLKGSSYEGVTLRNLLTMTSGIAFDESYNKPESDISRLLDEIAAGNRPGAVVDYMRHRPHIAPPGRKFAYSTPDVHVLGLAIAAATGQTLSELLSEAIWARFGMETDGYWLLESESGNEFAGCCISATLRDLARLGIFTIEADHAVGNGVIQSNWIDASTGLSTIKAAREAGYGDLWWVRSGGAFEALGIFGQSLYVDPRQRLVIGLQSAQPSAVGDKKAALKDAFIEAIARTLTE
jgi:CubicO group peptidase (beta-lactamase class C family)